MTDTIAVEAAGVATVSSNNNGIAVPIIDSSYARGISGSMQEDENNAGSNRGDKHVKRIAADESESLKLTKSRKTSNGSTSRLRIKEEKAESNKQYTADKADENDENDEDDEDDEDDEEEEEDEMEGDNSGHDETGPEENHSTLLSSNQLLEHHQQLLQSYAQASGQDLANLTASSLAQAMVSPIAVPGLTSNLLQQLQSGNVITALPGPPPQMTSQATNIPSDSLSEDGQVKRGPNVRNMSNDERRQRRLLRNRVAAKECRKKKKQYIQDMEEQITQLKDENARLHKEVDELNTKMTLGVGSESYRLMKEVVELNAKLGMSHLPSNSQLTDAVMAVVQQHQQQQQQPQTTQTSQPLQHQSSSSSPESPISQSTSQSAPIQPSASPPETKARTQSDGNKFTEVSLTKHIGAA